MGAREYRKALRSRGGYLPWRRDRRVVGQGTPRAEGLLQAWCRVALEDDLSAEEALRLAEDGEIHFSYPKEGVKLNKCRVRFIQNVGNCYEIDNFSSNPL